MRWKNSVRNRRCRGDLASRRQAVAVVSKGEPRSEQIGKQASVTLGPLVILPVSEIRCRGYKKRTARIRRLCFGAQRTRLRPQSVLSAGMKHSVESGKVETVVGISGLWRADSCRQLRWKRLPEGLGAGHRENRGRNGTL
jgi:hypothetical protein